MLPWPVCEIDIAPHPPAPSYPGAPPLCRLDASRAGAVVPGRMASCSAVVRNCRSGRRVAALLAPFAWPDAQCGLGFIVRPLAATSASASDVEPAGAGLNRVLVAEAGRGQAGGLELPARPGGRIEPDVAAREGAWPTSFLARAPLLT